MMKCKKGCIYYGKGTDRQKKLEEEKKLESKT